MYASKVDHQTHLVNDEIEITCCNSLPIQQTALLTPWNPTYTSTDLLHHHHLLHHLFLVGIKEVRQFLRPQAGVQLQKATKCGYGCLCRCVSEEQVEVSMYRVSYCGNRLTGMISRRGGRDEKSKRGRVIVRWRVGVDEFRARVNKQFLECC